MEAPQDMEVRPDHGSVDGCDTIAKVFLHRCRTLGNRTAHREKHLGIWQSRSWADYLEDARSIAMGLISLGLERGDVVSVLSEDNREWLCADLAVQCAGGIVCGIYPTDSAGQVASLLGESGSRFLFVENDEQLDKFLEIRARVPGIVRCIVFDAEGLHGLADEQVLDLEALRGIGRREHGTDPGRFERETQASRPDDTAILIYTSGTTGAPKGAMITHANLLHAVTAILSVLDTRQDDEQLCFLPLSHVLERMMSVYIPMVARSVVNFAESTETVFDDMREVSPSFVTAVPRVWEKIHSRLVLLAEEASPPGRLAFGRAVACGRARAQHLLEGRRVPLLLELRFRFWDWLVLANLRRMTGLDGARRVVTGAAPIAPDLVLWYWSIGLVMLEGYGMTESTGILTINRPDRLRAGSVGTAVPGVEVSVAPSGEILARSPVVFRGYWNDPAATAATLADGWLHTGDIGHVDNDGFVWLTGRLKDVIITSGGKNVSPAAIEHRMKVSPYIADAMVIGDRRRFLTALVMIDQENVETFAQNHDVPYSDFASLCHAPQVIDLIRAEVETANTHFARVEQIKDFRLIDRLLLPEDDELTATMKLRRTFVERRHGHLVDQMYGPEGEIAT